MDARDLSEFIIPWRADSRRTGKPIEPVVHRMSGWGQTANCLTTEPWSAVGSIADPQPSRASFASELCLLIPLSTAAVRSRAIPCSAAPQQRHKIVQNRLALVGEESVSGVTAELPPGQTGTPTHAHLHHRQRRNHAVPQGAGDSQ